MTEREGARTPSPPRRQSQPRPSHRPGNIAFSHGGTSPPFFPADRDGRELRLRDGPEFPRRDGPELLLLRDGAEGAEGPLDDPPLDDPPLDDPPLDDPPPETPLARAAFMPTMAGAM